MTKETFDENLAGFLAAYLNRFAKGDTEGEIMQMEGTMEEIITYAQSKNAPAKLRTVVEATAADAFSGLKCRNRDCADFGVDTTCNYEVTDGKIAAECSCCGEPIPVWPKGV